MANIYRIDRLTNWLFLLFSIPMESSEFVFFFFCSLLEAILRDFGIDIFERPLQRYHLRDRAAARVVIRVGAARRHGASAALGPVSGRARESEREALSCE